MAKIKSNLLGITLSDGVFSSKSKILCEHCAHPICEGYAAKSCKDFVPELRFSKNSSSGLVGEFNTFRLGSAWYKRLKPGMLVALSVCDKVKTYAEVIHIENGDKEELAELFAKDNHSIKSLGVEENQGEIMLKRLKNSYGTRAFDNNKLVTVIYLKVTGDEK